MAGWLKKVYAVMIRFVTPALILIVEIGGLQSEIAAGNTAVIVFATRSWRCAWWRTSPSSAIETPARTPTKSSPATTLCNIPYAHRYGFSPYRCFFHVKSVKKRANCG